MYTVTESKIVVEGREYITYGIKCREVCINDISADSRDVEQLIKQCNKYQLAPIHLHNVVEDFLE